MTRKTLNDFSHLDDLKKNPPTNTLIFALTFTAMIYGHDSDLLTLTDNLENRVSLSIMNEVYTSDKSRAGLNKLSVGKIFTFRNITYDTKTGMLSVNIINFFHYKKQTLFFLVDSGQFHFFTEK